MLLLYVLIFLFLMLILYQLYLANSHYVGMYYKPIIEGLENNDTKEVQDYKPYNLSEPNNSLILAQQNAGNIEVLKGRIDSYNDVQNGMKKKVDDMQQSIESMQTQIDGLVQQQADYAQELAGSTPPTITGTEEETADSIEEEMQ